MKLNDKASLHLLVTAALLLGADSGLSAPPEPLPAPGVVDVDFKNELLEHNLDALRAGIGHAPDELLIQYRLGAPMEAASAARQTLGELESEVVTPADKHGDGRG